MLFRSFLGVRIADAVRRGKVLPSPSKEGVAREPTANMTEPKIDANRVKMK